MATKEQTLDEQIVSRYRLSDTFLEEVEKQIASLRKTFRNKKALRRLRIREYLSRKIRSEFGPSLLTHEISVLQRHILCTLPVFKAARTRSLKLALTPVKAPAPQATSIQYTEPYRITPQDYIDAARKMCEAHEDTFPVD